MKRLMLLALALLFAGVMPYDAYGQSILRGLIEDDANNNSMSEDTVPPQRIGVPEFDMNLSENSTGSVTGYCFDEYLIAPTRPTRFENVLAGNSDATVTLGDGRTMALKDAIAKGAVSVEALQLRVTFANHTNAPMTIQANRPVVLWDRKGGSVNEGAIKVLETRKGDYDWQQKMVWRNTTAERLLGVLGYYEGSVWDIDRDKFRMATARFQRDYSLPENDGQLAEGTINQLLQINDDLRARLRAIGFRDRAGRSIREDLAMQIRGYQKYLGQPVTGRWSPELTTRLAVDERTIPQVNALRVDGRSIAEVLADNPKTSNVLTYLNDSKSLMILTGTEGDMELWSRSNRAVTFEGRGLKAITKLDDAAAALAARASKDDRVVIYPRASQEGKMTLMVGDRAVEIDGASLNRYLDGGAAPKELAGVLEPMMPSPGSEMTGRRTAPKLIVYRGPLMQGRSGEATLARVGLRQADGTKLASALDRTYGDRSSIYVSDDLRSGASQFRGGEEDMGSLDTPRTSSARFALAR